MGRTVLSSKDIALIRTMIEQGGRQDAGSLLELRTLGLEGLPAEKPDLRPDNYRERLLKYIPAEVVAMYLTVDSLVRSRQPVSVTLSWLAFAAGLIAVPAYLVRIQSVRKRKQIAISMGAFVVWVLAIGGPFVHLSWYDPLVAGILLVVYTFFIPIIEG